MGAFTCSTLRLENCATNGLSASGRRSYKIVASVHIPAYAIVENALSSCVPSLQKVRTQQFGPLSRCVGCDLFCIRRDGGFSEFAPFQNGQTEDEQTKSFYQCLRFRNLRSPFEVATEAVNNGSRSSGTNPNEPENSALVESNFGYSSTCAMVHAQIQTRRSISMIKSLILASTFLAASAHAYTPTEAEVVKAPSRIDDFTK